MKKYLIAAGMVLMGLCASAQTKGDMAVGLNLGVAPCLEDGADCTNFGIGAKFQYNVTDPIRLEGNLNYWLKDKGISVFDVSANVHYLFSIGGGCTLYPLVGVGYASISPEYGDSEGRLLVNAGVGFGYNLTENLTLGAEVKYQYIDDFSRMPISVGVAYKF